VLYYATVVTAEAVTAGTELTYDYCYSRNAGEDGPRKQGSCQCGAPGCGGQLLF
jgi:hypothetical protein